MIGITVFSDTIIGQMQHVSVVAGFDSATCHSKSGRSTNWAIKVSWLSRFQGVTHVQVKEPNLLSKSFLFAIQTSILTSNLLSESSLFAIGPKIKFYLFPLTRPTLKKGPYPKNFISIFSLELFFLKFIGNLRA